MNSLQSLNPYINIKTKSMCIKLQVSFYSSIQFDVSCCLSFSISLAIQLFSLFAFLFIFYKYFHYFLFGNDFDFSRFSHRFFTVHLDTLVFHRTKPKLVFAPCYVWFFLFLFVFSVSLFGVFWFPFLYDFQFTCQLF